MPVIPTRRGWFVGANTCIYTDINGGAIRILKRSLKHLRGSWCPAISLLEEVEMSLTHDVKDYALDLGYSKVGITSADPFSDHVAELESRGDTYSFYTRDPRNPLAGAHPKSLMPSARSIISLVRDYARESFPDKLLGMIGRAYLARAYGPPADRINGARYRLMGDFLRKSGCRVGHGIFLPERRVAARAGTTTFGKNNFAYASGIGSFVILSSFVVDAELEVDSPTVKVKCPEGCRACLDACPTGAIREPLKLVPQRCISFNNWWTQDGRPGVTSHIPKEIRIKMGTRIHGCDYCQEACPRNQRRLKADLPGNDYLNHVSDDFSLGKVLNMTDEFFEKRVRPLMYNYIRDKRYFRRNAAIAIGNVGDPAYVPDLAIAMNDPDELVRAYASWALGRIGGNEAMKLLEAGLKRETSALVGQEIADALAERR